MLIGDPTSDQIVRIQGPGAAPLDRESWFYARAANEARPARFVAPGIALTPGCVSRWVTQ